MLNELSLELFANAPGLFAKRTEPGDVRYLGLPGSPLGGTCTFLAFVPDASAPLFVAKIHRRRGTHAPGELEMARIQDGAPKRFLTTIPRLLYHSQIKGYWTIVSSYCSGEMMAVNMGDNGLPMEKQAHSNLSKITQWLIDFRHVSRRSILGKREDWDTKMDKRVRWFQKVYGLTRAQDRTIEDSLQRLKLAAPEGERSWVVHGDFTRHNVLLQHNQIGVIDWSYAQLDGLPLYDFYQFATGYYAQFHRKQGIQGYLDGYCSTFFDVNPFSRMVATQLKSLCDSVGLDGSLVAEYHLLFLLEQSYQEGMRMDRLLRTDGLPRFPTSLGISMGRCYSDARHEQLWPYYLKHLCQNWQRFMPFKT